MPQTKSYVDVLPSRLTLDWSGDGLSLIRFILLKQMCRSYRPSYIEVKKGGGESGRTTTPFSPHPILVHHENLFIKNLFYMFSSSRVRKPLSFWLLRSKWIINQLFILRSLYSFFSSCHFSCDLSQCGTTLKAPQDIISMPTSKLFCLGKYPLFVTFSSGILCWELKV